MQDRGLHRWCGGKSHLTAKVIPIAERHLRETKGRVVSLFYGTGALERTIGAYDAPQIVAEGVPDLRCLYRVLAQPDGIAQLNRSISLLLEGRERRVSTKGTPDEQKASSVEFYNFVRERTFSTDGDLDALVAARFLFLVGTCFNGLWRVNGDGKMNTPCDPARVMSWTRPTETALKIAQMNAKRLTVVDDWTEAAPLARPGDLILADPPYATGFDSYTRTGFGPEHQAQLAAFLADFDRHQCGVIAFNSPDAARLYASSKFKVETVERSGRISSKGDGRDPVAEIIITGSLKGRPQ